MAASNGLTVVISTSLLVTPRGNYKFKISPELSNRLLENSHAIVSANFWR